MKAGPRLWTRALRLPPIDAKVQARIARRLDHLPELPRYSVLPPIGTAPRASSRSESRSSHNSASDTSTGFTTVSSLSSSSSCYHDSSTSASGHYAYPYEEPASALQTIRSPLERHRSGLRPPTTDVEQLRRSRSEAAVGSTRGRRLHPSDAAEGRTSMRAHDLHRSLRRCHSDTPPARRVRFARDEGHHQLGVSSVSDDGASTSAYSTHTLASSALESVFRSPSGSASSSSSSASCSSGAAEDVRSAAPAAKVVVSSAQATPSSDQEPLSLRPAKSALRLARAPSKWFRTVKLGEGGEGTVYGIERRASHDSDGSDAAAPLSRQPSGLRWAYKLGPIESLEHEQKAYKQLGRHAKLTASSRDPDLGWLVTERVPNVCWFNQGYDLCQTRQQRASILGDAMDQVANLHANDVAHRDISVGNLVASVATTEDETGKMHVVGTPYTEVIDFGMATLSLAEPSKTCFGTPWSQAPETLGQGWLGGPADVFSLASIIFRVLFGRFPYRQISHPGARYPALVLAFAVDAAKKYGAPLPRFVAPPPGWTPPAGTPLKRHVPAFGMLERMLALDPDERPSMAVLQSVLGDLWHQPDFWGLPPDA